MQIDTGLAESCAVDDVLIVDHTKSKGSQSLLTHHSAGKTQRIDNSVISTLRCGAVIRLLGTKAGRCSHGRCLWGADLKPSCHVNPELNKTKLCFLQASGESSKQAVSHTDTFSISHACFPSSKIKAFWQLYAMVVNGRYCINVDDTTVSKSSDEDSVSCHAQRHQTRFSFKFLDYLVDSLLDQLDVPNPQECNVARISMLSSCYSG